MLKKILLIVVVGAALGVGFGVATDGPGEPEVVRAGYYMSEDRHRIITFHTAGPLTEEQAIEVFESVTHTQGRMTRALIYEGADNTPPDADLTLAKSIQEAMALTANPPHDDWAWRMQINPAGLKTITDQ